MNDLNITIIQSNLHWENIPDNLSMFSQKISNINESTDLIVLPEMFTTGFSMNAEKFAETMNGATVNWLASESRKKNCVITGSFICEEKGNYFNRSVWMRPDGTHEIYDKRHLFRMANEDHHYSAGNDKIIVELKGWRICPLICYDLRFPVWSRNYKRTANGDQAIEKKQDTILHQNINPQYMYDILIYVANWPERRNHAWNTLLMARAIENQCYVVGVNRVGNDGNAIEHSGDSVIINAKGEIISKNNSHKEFVETVTINLEELEKFRTVFPAILDADDFFIS